MSYENFGWRDLMLGLIYPAVLGTVFYALLSALGTPAVPTVATWLGQKSVSLPGTPFQPFKATLLLITFFFYLGDYFYVMYTKVYLKRYFLYSVIFLAGLAFTVAAIGIDRRSEPVLPVVIAAYAVFMLFYLFWDVNEWLRDRDSSRAWFWFATNDQNERWFYPVVFLWELVSFIVLAVHARRAAIGIVEPARVTVVLIAVTALFGLVALWKRSIYARWVEVCNSDSRAS